MCRKTASIALVCVGALALLALLWVLPAALLYCSAQVALLGSGEPAWLAVVLSPASVVLALLALVSVVVRFAGFFVVPTVAAGLVCDIAAGRRHAHPASSPRQQDGEPGRSPGVRMPR